MALVTVVIACWVNARSAIFRLFLAIRMFRRLAKKPKPFRSCCENETVRDEVTSGLKKLNAELDDWRELFQVTFMVVPLEKPCEYCVLYWAACETRLAAVAVLVPVPEMKGLFTGVVRSSIASDEVIVGSKLRKGMLAFEKRSAAPLTPCGRPPDSVWRMSVSPNQVL